MKNRHALKPDAGNVGGFLAVQAAQVYAGARGIVRTWRKGVFEDALENRGRSVIRIKR
jgi:hypothetical protein